LPATPAETGRQPNAARGRPCWARASGSASWSGTEPPTTGGRS